ncbi:MAG: hypothetical protein ACI8PZ_001003 [Myxococcota bacterium]|jgi:hypothetical protein
MVRFGLVGLLVSGCTIDPTPSWDGNSEGVQSEAPSVYTNGDDTVEEPVAAGSEDDPVLPGDDDDKDDARIAFTQQATTYWSTNGIAVGHNGDEGLMGMSGGGACVIFPDDGSLGDEEDVHDCPDDPGSYFEDGSVLVAGIGCDDVSIYDGNGRVLDIAVPGLLGSEAIGNDFVALQSVDGSCELTQRHLDAVVSVTPLPVEACGERVALVTDAANGVTYIAAGSLWAVADGDAALLSESAGDLLALDRASGTLVAGFRGDTELSGLALDGAELWTQPTLGPLARLHEIGSTGAVMAQLMNDWNDVGRFVAYGVADGSVWGESIAWPQIVDLDISSDGSTMVVSTDNSRVYSYGIRLND